MLEKALELAVVGLEVAECLQLLHLARVRLSVVGRGEELVCPVELENEIHPMIRAICY